MNYYKPMHQQSPEQILHRSNQLFLRIIALYVLIAACGFGIDIKFYHAADDRIYYLVENKIENDESITADLRYYGQQKQYPPNSNSSISRFLKLQIARNGQDQLTVKIVDNNSPRFQFPEEAAVTNNLPKSINLADLDISITDDYNIFRLRIARRKGGIQGDILGQNSIIHFLDRSFIFSDKVIRWGSSLDSKYLWGLGQRNTESFLLKKSGNYTIWSKSQLSGVFDEGQQDHQANSFHPMYLSKEALPKSWHILAMRTSSGIGFEYNYNENITFNMMGGIFYLKIFIGDSPGKVIESYHKYLGGYLIPPFWATGFHQSRRGYNKSDALIQVWDNFNKHRLPIDAVWSDVDYMSNFETFTIDFSRFNTTAMMDTMLDASQKAVKWLPTIPSSIHTEQALAKNYTGLVVKSGNYEGKPLVGCGLSGTVYFPDYNNPNTVLQLEYSLKTLMQILPFDGVHLIEAELLNLIDGEATSIKDVKCGIISGSGVNKSNGFYTNFSSVISTSDLNQRSLPLNAKRYGSEDSAIARAPSPLEDNVEYDFHNINSLATGKAAYESLKRLDIRHPLVMSTSTFFGMGKYSGHIVQDSYSDFSWLAMSLPAIFNFQLFGMPFTGVDICGKEGNATAELCARWMALGSMYPFARNHNSLGGSPQQPYAFNEPFVLEASLKSLRLRYSLLKYYYSVYATTYGVGTVFSPLFVEFPEDSECLDLQTQAMIGPALMITPVLSQSKIGDVTTIKPYFPQGTWFSIQDPNVRFAGGATKSFNVSFNESCPTFIREGYLVIYQDAQLESGEFVTRTYELDNRFILLIALIDYEQGYESDGFLVSISNYSEYMDRCVETEEDCVIEVRCVAEFVNQTDLELNVTFDVELIDTFTDLLVTGVKVYLQDFKTKELNFDKPIQINPENHSFNQTLVMESLKSTIEIP